MIPQYDAGCLIDPPVSDPSEIMQRSAATDTALPPEEPPGTRVLSIGFQTGPWNEFSFDDPIANSSQFTFPIIIASSFSNLSTAVAL